ncbi:hypothetical protein [Streptomyces sp. enrichment culture]|uniref:hypothetical protein n=1 Tax=Streptomyces sp. enrichment culture TaxID=1795815 RepID=UPI003F562004
MPEPSPTGVPPGPLEAHALQALTRTLGPDHPHTVSARHRARPHWDFEPYLG